jgi:hypothetical protein
MDDLHRKIEELSNAGSELATIMKNELESGDVSETRMKQIRLTLAKWDRAMRLNPHE